MAGYFITLEGGDGCGKSTQTDKLDHWFKNAGYETVILKNHAATPLTQKIRELRLSGTDEGWTPRVEAILLFTVWCDLCDQLIKPALNAGKVVIADRFIDSTYVYQAYANNLPFSEFAPLRSYALGDLEPDATFLLDIPVEDSLKRLTGELDRIEKRGNTFHQMVRDGYLKLAKEEQGRIHTVDATQPADKVFADIVAIVQSRLLSSAA